MDNIISQCPYCGDLMEVWQNKENTKMKCHKCRKEFMAYEVVQCHKCGKQKHPNNKCRNCDAVPARTVDTADVLKTLINPFPALAKLTRNANPQETKANRENETEKEFS